jgi:hypothetical protein
LQAFKKVVIVSMTANKTATVALPARLDLAIQRIDKSVSAHHIVNSPGVNEP